MTQSPKVAIITGASSGIGPGISDALLKNGFNLVISGRHQERLEAEATRLGQPGKVMPVIADVSVANDRLQLVEKTREHFGRIDVLVNNAGIFSPKPFLEVTEGDLDQYLSTNLKGTYFLTQLVIPSMREAGGGAIINTGTVLVDHALGGVPATAPISSKGGIHALTIQLATEFGPENIRVNTIAPGIIRTPMHARNGFENPDDLSGLHLLNRIGEPEHIGSMALELATNEFMSGTIINVDGGHVAGHTLS